LSESEYFDVDLDLDFVIAFVDLAVASKIKYNYAGSSDSDGIDDGSDFSASSKDIEENSDDEYELY
jgi:hypothetical protein